MLGPRVGETVNHSDLEWAALALRMMLRLTKKSPLLTTDHEELFMERYGEMLRWSLHLAGNDVDLAEDLLHDAFIHWTFTRPDLSAIQNLSGYLYEILRNLRISQMRRATRNRLEQLSIFEYDQAEAGLRTIDPRERVQVFQELQHVCRYVCARKETSKGGSILVLRFFHGYYPSEIASILKSSRGSVDQRLRMTRIEIRASLASPERLGLLNANSPTKELGGSVFAPTGEQLLIELRGTIFASRSGECLSSTELSNLYQSKGEVSLDCATLAHIVSCVRCLDEVSGILGIPTLAERHAFDSLSLDRSSRGGPPATGGGGGASTESMRPFRSRAKEVFEQRPQELHISVNGFILGSQKINAGLNELTLDVTLVEPVSFVEVFSEQETRLLFFKAGEAPPNGPIRQGVKIALSDDRSLELELQFRTPCPVLHATYRDPLIEPEDASELTARDQASVTKESGKVTPGFGFGFRWQSRLLLEGRRFFDSRFLLRPGVVTAIVTFGLMFVALLMLRSPSRVPIAAADLLRQATEMEEAVAMKPDRVLHRIISLEERAAKYQPSSTGVDSTGTSKHPLAIHRIEVWRNGANKLAALRVYDQQDGLVSGTWTKEDSTRVLLHHGAKLQPLTARRVSASSINFDNVWQVLPSAEGFAVLLGENEKATVTETATDYTVVLQRDEFNVDGVQRASLVLSRPELRATKQTLLVKQRDEVREYTFTETSFEVHPSSNVAPAVFEPDPELLGNAGMRGRGDAGNLSVSPSLLVSPSVPLVASAELEVEVLSSLNRVNALLGEQLGVERTLDGTLFVSGIVETRDRKNEIVQSLQRFAGNPAIKIDIRTVAEAEARRKQRSSANTTLEEIQVAQPTVPAEAELRAYFSGRGLSRDQIEQQIKQLSSRVINGSTRARSHALAIKQIAERFSMADLQVMQPTARTQWRTMIIQHAESFNRELEQLRLELGPLFPTSGTAGGALSEIKSDYDIANAAKRLFELEVANDVALRRSFAVSTEPVHEAPVRGADFWRLFASAESLATKIARQ